MTRSSEFRTTSDTDLAAMPKFALRPSMSVRKCSHKWQRNRGGAGRRDYGVELTTEHRRAASASENTTEFQVELT